MTERNVTIDAVRGFAVLGILLMNIVGQGLPSYAYVSPAYYGGDTGANLAAWALSFVLVDGKMRGLFTLLFGASLLLITNAAEERAPGPARTHYARMVWLFVFGSLHAWFIWYGDILVAYSLAGSLAFLARKESPRRLTGAGLVILGALIAWEVIGHIQLQQLRTLATAPGASPELAAQWREALAHLAPPAEAGRAEILGYRGGFIDAFQVRAPMVIFFYTALLPFGFIWEALGFMLIGMGLYRLGFFTGRLSTAAYARIGAVLIPVGIVFGAQIAGYLWMVGWDPVTTMMTDALAIPIRLLMTVGYAAAVIAIVKSGAARGAVERLAACGRMAFTNYLGANIVTTTIFYGYGLGLFARLERAELYLIVLAVWAVQLAVSKPWLERFRYGPFEWAWRSLARWQREPLRLRP